MTKKTHKATVTTDSPVTCQISDMLDDLEAAMELVHVDADRPHVSPEDAVDAYASMELVRQALNKLLNETRNDN